MRKKLDPDPTCEKKLDPDPTFEKKPGSGSDLREKTGSGSDPREKTGSIPDSPKTTRIRIVCNFHIKIKKSFDIKDNLFDLLIYIITLVDKYYIKSSILEGSYTLMLGPDPDPSIL